MEPHDERSSVSAAGSMDTTIADQARLWAGIVRGEGRQRGVARRAGAAAGRHHLGAPVPDAARLGRAERNAEIGLAAGLGLVTFRDTSGPAFFKGGHNDWTGNMAICLEARRRCVVMLANDVRAERIYPELAQLVLGETAMPWDWEYEWFAERRARAQAPASN